ncbi:DUF916 and DUF3324 domain-containing protein [Enterococcus mundtii]|uniref:DUF916 and DUF3324 domain-containing protein n=1 Tax=Enterococcus mundtii TaxID=53346 RepID=UPI00082580AE|nr:DUF916 and DUF3324 domain-containing protein [Enterococcus mundtii]
MPNRSSLMNPLKPYFLVIALLFTFLFPSVVRAEEGTLKFYVTPEFPESQVDGVTNYFSLQGEPNSTHTLRLKIQNAGDEEKTVQVTAHTAFTNVMGVVEYGKDALNPDPTLTHPLAELIDLPEPIVLAGKETKTIEFDLHMPEEAFEGYLAGGLRIEEVLPEEEIEPSEEEGVAIQNEFAYVVAVLASNERASLKPDLELLDVFADQLNYRNVISANLQNFRPAFANQLAVEATVQKVGEEEILYEEKKEMMQMAPNSNFHFPISLEGDRFRSGEYVLKMKASSGSEEWEWERTFTIEADEARALNRADVTIDTGINWWIVAGVSLIVLLLMIIVWLLLKKKKSERADSVNEN